MAVYLCHEQPDLYEHAARVVDAAPGRVLLDRSALHPGGGGQVSDVGWIESGRGVTTITGVDVVAAAGGEEHWLLLGDDTE